eukprot:4346675-Prymnesium_polylepis.1
MKFDELDEGLEGAGHVADDGGLHKLHDGQAQEALKELLAVESPLRVELGLLHVGGGGVHQDEELRDRERSRGLRVLENASRVGFDRRKADVGSRGEDSQPHLVDILGLAEGRRRVDNLAVGEERQVRVEANREDVLARSQACIVVEGGEDERRVRRQHGVHLVELFLRGAIAEHVRRHVAQEKLLVLVR